MYRKNLRFYRKLLVSITPSPFKISDPVLPYNIFDQSQVKNDLYAPSIELNEISRDCKSHLRWFLKGLYLFFPYHSRVSELSD